MKERELAIVLSNDNKNGSIYETIDTVAEAGFKNAFIQWYDADFEVPQEEQLAYARKKGLHILFAHLGYQNINDLWDEEKDAKDLIERYKKDILECKKNEIPLVVMHLTQKSVAPPMNLVAIRRLQEICDYAQSLDMKVAFENTKIKGYVEYALDHIQNKNVGFCFDSGHYHAHFKDELDFSRMKDRIFAVHLHDNNGEKDEHLIPYEGTINWQDVVNKLIECSYEGPVTMEQCYQKDYLQMPLYTFYEKSKKAGEKIQQEFQKSAEIAEKDE